MNELINNTNVINYEHFHDTIILLLFNEVI